VRRHVYPQNAELLDIKREYYDKYARRANCIFSRASLRNDFSATRAPTHTISICPLSRAPLSRPCHATSVAIISNRTEVVTRHCIRINYNDHASHMRDTRVLQIMNIYPDGFIFHMEEINATLVFINLP